MSERFVSEMVDRGKALIGPPGRQDLSRREFLKLSGYGLMGMVFPALRFSAPPQDDFSDLLGRVIDRTLWSREAPDAKSARRRMYWRDLVLPITNTAISEDETAYNRVWYELAEGGYVYSGSLQPVRTLLNQPRQIPITGLLGDECPIYGCAR